jgi:hypothetical protein
MARGREFTVDLYVSRSGQCICAVPHWRMGSMRRGGVQGRHCQGPGADGVGLPCCRVPSRGPRSPEHAVLRLAHEAGAHFTDWLLDEREGRELTRFDAGWTTSRCCAMTTQCLSPAPGSPAHDESLRGVRHRRYPRTSNAITCGAPGPPHGSEERILPNAAATRMRAVSADRSSTAFWPIAGYREAGIDFHAVVELSDPRTINRALRPNCWAANVRSPARWPSGKSSG